jgi:hypothetical protein
MLRSAAAWTYLSAAVIGWLASYRSGLVIVLAVSWAAPVAVIATAAWTRRNEVTR